MTARIRLGSWLRKAPQRGAPGAATTLLLLALCVYVPWLARNSWRETTWSDGNAAVPAAPVPAHPSQQLQNVLAASLFGRQPASAEQPATQVADDLVLAGVIAFDDPKNGFAIIRATADAGKLRRVGEEWDGIRLVAVHRTHVLLERGAAIVQLELMKRRTAGQTAEPALAAVESPRNEIPPSPNRS